MRVLDSPPLAGRGVCRGMVASLPGISKRFQVHSAKLGIIEGTCGVYAPHVLFTPP